MYHGLRVITESETEAGTGIRLQVSGFRKKACCPRPFVGHVLPSRYVTVVVGRNRIDTTRR
jgi:hypothetical protein